MLRHWLAGSPRHQAASRFFRTDRPVLLRLLPTPPSGPQLLFPFDDAVTFGFRPVKRLVERGPTSFSDALSGALAHGFSRGNAGRQFFEPASAGDRQD